MDFSHSHMKQAEACTTCLLLPIRSLLLLSSKVPGKALNIFD